MVAGIFAALALFLTSMVCALAAWAVTRLKPNNRAWSVLWSVGLWVAVLAPIVGGLLAYCQPQSASEWSHSGLLNAITPGFAVGVQRWTDVIEATSAMNFRWLGWVALSVYGIGVVIALLSLSIGRRRVRLIARKSQPSTVVDGGLIFTSSAANVPFAWTPFGRPIKSRVILPTGYLTAFLADDLKQIVAQERAHIARRDDEHGLCFRILLAILWISPFAHFSFARWSEATELQCDAQIMKDCSHQVRVNYARVLIEALKVSADRVRQYPAAAFSHNRLRNEKMRIANIMSGNGPVIKRVRTHLALSGAAALMVAATGSGLASLAHAEPVGLDFEDRSHVGLENIVDGRLTAPFGKTFDPFRDGSTRVHQGVDIGAPIGTAIIAPADGQIIEATHNYRNQSAYGNVVVLPTANNTLTLFSHLDTFSVQPGTEVGNTGNSTGPHVHIETMVNGQHVDPLTVWLNDQ